MNSKDNKTSDPHILLLNLHKLKKKSENCCSMKF